MLQKCMFLNIDDGDSLQASWSYFFFLHNSMLKYRSYIEFLITISRAVVLATV